MKKILLGLASVATIATPLSLAASCGNDTPGATPEPQGTEKPHTTEEARAKSDETNKKGPFDRVGRWDETNKKGPFDRVGRWDETNKKGPFDRVGRWEGLAQKEMTNHSPDLVYKKEMEKIDFNILKHDANNKLMFNEGNKDGEINAMIERAIPFQAKDLHSFSVQGFGEKIGLQNKITIMPYNLLGYSLYQTQMNGDETSAMDATWAFVKVGSEPPFANMTKVTKNEDMVYFVINLNIEEAKSKDFIEVFAWNKNDRHNTKDKDNLLDFAQYLDIKENRPVDWNTIPGLAEIGKNTPVAGEGSEFELNVKKERYRVIATWILNKLFEQDGQPIANKIK